MIPERYLNFLSEISGKFPIGNFGKLPRPIPTCKLLHFLSIYIRQYNVSPPSATYFMAGKNYAPYCTMLELINTITSKKLILNRDKQIEKLRLT